MQNPVFALFLVAKEQAKNGVEYSNRFGAVCPFCGQTHLRTYSTKKWDGRTRVRYHHCQNPKCLLNKFRQSIKSVQLSDADTPEQTVYCHN